MITAKDVAKAHKILNGVVVNTPLEFEPITQSLNSQKKNVNVGWCVLQRGTTPKVWPIPVMK